MRISREEFDHEARQLFPDDTVKLHNQFLLAIINKCQILAAAQDYVPTPIKKRKVKKRTQSSSTPKQHFQQRFLPANSLLQAPNINFPDVDDRGLTFANRELVLPDIGMIHGRMIVSAWDYGLEGVNDNAVRLLLNSIEVAMKNILTVLCSHRSTCQIREGCFRYAMGMPLPQTRSRTVNSTDYSRDSHSTIVNSKGHVPNTRPTLQCAERNAAMSLSASTWPTPNKYPISLFDMFHALQLNKGCIPSHAVYAINMERISNKLWHPSQEDLYQESMMKQETAIN